MIDISKAFDLVPHDWLLKKLAASGVDSRVVVWVREFFVGRTQRVRVGQLSKQVKGTSGVPQGSVLGPLLFLVYVNDIWRNINLSIRLFADDCIIYRKTQIKRHRKVAEGSGHLGRNVKKINTGKSKAIRFTRAQVKIH
jgi:retron-type reverse transcriptase